MVDHRQPHRGQQSSSAVVVPKVGDAKPMPTGGLGRLNNAADFAVTKLEDLINWGRNVSLRGDMYVGVFISLPIVAVRVYGSM